jgi:hypothetical protein
MDYVASNGLMINELDRILEEVAMVSTVPVAVSRQWIFRPSLQRQIH